MIGRKQFQNKKGNFDVNIVLNRAEDAPSISIQLTDSRTTSRYSLKIGEEYIQAQDPLFISNIQSIAELYEHLVAEFDQFIITEQGVIIFEIQVMIKKKLERKAYRIEGEKQFNEIEKLRQQIEQLRRQMKRDLQKQDQRIAELELKQESTKEEINQEISTLCFKIGRYIDQGNIQRQKDNNMAKRQFQRIMVEFKKSNELIKQSTADMMVHIEEREKATVEKIREMRQETERFAEGLAIINRIVDEHQQKLREILKLKEKLSIDKLKGKFDYLKMHPENPNKNSFKVTEEINAIVITRIGQDGQDLSYFGAQQLKKGEAHYFNINLCKMENKFIMVGIGSKKAFGVQGAFKHKQTLTYHVYDGTVNELGINRKGGFPADYGALLTVIVDLKQEYTVKWLINGQSQATANLSPQMRASPLYFLVIMYNTEDEIHILI